MYENCFPSPFILQNDFFLIKYGIKLYDYPTNNAENRYKYCINSKIKGK